MHITVIGAGNIGGTLVRLLAARGHQLTVANSRGASTLADLARETGAVPVDLSALPRDSDVVVIAVPPGALPQLHDVIAPLPETAVVVETGNYVPGLRDERVEAIDAGLPESVWSATVLGRPIVKAFNTIAEATLRGAGEPSERDHRIAAPVAGDDPVAKERIIGLLDEIGFDGFDAGSLADSWRQQPGTPVYTADLPLEQAQQAIRDARATDTVDWRTHMAR